MATSITNTSVTTDNLTVDTNALYVDSTNNRVGVNTTNPGSTLEINGAAQVTGNALTVSDAGFNSRFNLFNTGSGGSNFSIYSTMSSFGQGANTFLLYSPNATAGIIKAHEDGYITTPYQPVSQIACTNAGLTTNGNRYEGTANVNIGSGWSNGSNQYTAPVTGTYLVNFSGWTNYTASYGYMGFYKNGANYYTWHYNHGNYQMHTFASGMLYMDLAQNDVITFIRAGGGSGTFQGMYFNISLFG